MFALAALAMSLAQLSKVVFLVRRRTGQLNCCQEESQGLFQPGCSDPWPGKEPGSWGSFIPAGNHPFFQPSRKPRELGTNALNVTQWDNLCLIPSNPLAAPLAATEPSNRTFIFSSYI